VAESFDVVVIGLGAFGAATVFQLASRSVRVLGIDRFAPPHDRGSSHGETRITRQAIGEGEVYCPLAIRSHQIWRELEAETGEQLMLECGFAAIDTSGGQSNMHGRTGFVERTITAAVNLGFAHELLGPEEARYRYPGLILPDDAQIYFERGGGLVFPERCIAAQIAGARQHGAQVRLGETATQIVPQDEGVLVTTQRRQYRSSRVVLAAGGWAPSLVGGKTASQMRLLRQTLHWFPTTRPNWFGSAAFPTFIWTHGPGIADSFYGFPIVEGLTQAVKVATEQYTETSPTPEAMRRAVDPAEARDMHRSHVAGRLAGLGSGAIKSVACLYTQTPDSDFLIGPPAADSPIVLLSACSGHGFKHSAGVGEMVAKHLCDGAEIPACFLTNRERLS
jgi:sarcosine oxidase